MDKALRYLAMAAKAKRIVVGAEDCEKNLKKHQGKLLVAAADAAENTLTQALAMTGGKVELLHRTAYTKQQIARAIGRGNPVALVLICDEGLAQAFAAADEMDRATGGRV